MEVNYNLRPWQCIGNRHNRMKKYIGTKEIKATPAIRKGGVVYLPGDAIPRTMDPVEEGYKVIYEDGYESWSPKDVFEKAYKVADTFKDRLVIEQQELADKLLKLSLFVDGEKFPEVVPELNQRVLLLHQREAMSDYLHTLNERIKTIAD